MSTDLNDWVESLKRYVAVPGDFDTYFPDTTDDDLVGSLLDGFGEAQLDGFFLAGTGSPGWTATDAGIVTPDLTRGEMALIVLYASTRIVQTQLLNLKNRQRYEAKGALFETEQASNVLTTLLKQFNDRKTEIIQRLRTVLASSAFDMADSYFIKAVGPFPGTEMYYYGGDIDRAYDYHNPFGGW